MVPFAVAVQISRAIGELHQRRIVHKDLEPANVFVVGGTIKLTGFVLFVLGEGIDRPEGDFGREVAEMAGGKS